MNLQKTNQKEELVNCTFVKTVLMLIVVFFHSIVFWRGGWFDIIEPAESFLPYSIVSDNCSPRKKDTWLPFVAAR